ncbi:MAG TPA: CcdB family protein [Lysobacter sp.]|nr:CcdB family protein [Lysobacter sp.]
MQFAVFANADERTRDAVPYLLDVQSDLIAKARTCVVVPIIALARAGRPIDRLMPVFEFGGGKWVMDTLQLAGVPHRTLGAPVADLSAERTRILAALDMLVSGI